ncbi:acetylxylan esterase [Ornithinimicrobium sp. Y1847]|uniref:acetylxylan esterase n=1 Tax=Ornithinimicrobium sp. Y1847 TaxID=3405419 RepID=UPI003B673AC8
MHSDLPLEELRTYRPEVAEPADFDTFWSDTLEHARSTSSTATAVSAHTPLTTLTVQDVTFPGFDGDPVRAWFLRPPGDEPLPCVVEFLGYGGGRGVAHERLTWGSAGFAHLVMDTRGQGSGWGSGGATADPHGSGPAFPGFMTRGIQSPQTYYYRRLMTDAVRAVDYALSRPDVRADQVAVEGTSQGGGLALAAGALHGRVAAVLSHVPFLCHFARALSCTDAFPYQEVVAHLAVHRGTEEQVLRTLSYVDGVNMARRISCPALVSVALMDQTCPPSTVFAAINHLEVTPTVEVYPYNRHEGGEAEQWGRSVTWLRGVFAAATD